MIQTAVASKLPPDFSVFPKSRIGPFSLGPVLKPVSWFGDAVATRSSALFVFQIRSPDNVSLASVEVSLFPLMSEVVGGVLSGVIPAVECEPVPLNLTASHPANR